jgi:hypothetical protein
LFFTLPFVERLREMPGKTFQDKNQLLAEWNFTGTALLMLLVNMTGVVLDLRLFVKYAKASPTVLNCSASLLQASGKPTKLNNANCLLLSL